MFSVVVDADARRVFERVGFGHGRALKSGLRAALKPIGETTVNRVVYKSLSARNTVTFPQLRRRAPLGVRTGGLRRAVQYRVESGSGPFPSLRVGVFSGPALGYARILEEGGRIRSHGKLLAVPGKGAEQYDSPTEYPGTLRYISLNRGKLAGIMVATTDRGRESRSGPIWFMMRYVDIPRFAWLSKPVNDYVPTIVDRVADWMVSYARG